MVIRENVTKFGKNSIAFQFFLAGMLIIEGTVCNNRKEIPAECKMNKALHETSVMKSEGKNNTITTLKSYQCKKSKNVLILSTLHPDVPIHREKNSKKKPETVFSIIRIK